MPVLLGHQGDHGFEEPLGLMSDCHRRIERFLRAMLVVSREEKGRPLSEGGRRALRQASNYFRTAGPMHTADEEESLFPLLRARSVGDTPGVGATIDALESEHRSHEAVHARVDALVSRWLGAARNGLSEREARDLTASLETLERAYAAHLEIEDNELFPLARTLLADHEVEDLGRQMAVRRGLLFRGPLARFLEADHARLHGFLAASLTGEGVVREEPFGHFRAGILRHISMEEKYLVPRVTAARNGKRPAIMDLLQLDHSAIAALLVPPPTRELIIELRAILDRHDGCEEGPAGLYGLCDRALGSEAALRLVAQLEQHPPVALKPYNTSPRVAKHLRRSVDRSWDAWRRREAIRGDGAWW